MTGRYHTGVKPKARDSVHGGHCGTETVLKKGPQ
jgi:hypothetical protein